MRPSELLLHAQLHAHITKTPTPHLLNALLRSLAHSGAPDAALHVYNHLLRHSAPHDHFSYTYAVKACCALLPRRPAHAAAKGREIHARAVRSGHGTDIFIQNSLVSFYSASGDIDSARRVFSGITGADVVSWTAIVSGLARNGCEGEAVAAFTRMGVEPNPMTLVAVLSACSRLGALELGKAVHGYGLRGYAGGCNVILDNAVLAMYMYCGAPEFARHLFERMRVRDVVSWTTMVSGYGQNGRPEEGIRAFYEMVLFGEAVPNEATVVSVLGACASIGDLSLVKWVNSFMDEIGVGVDGPAGNALINVYAKCGDITSALEVFDARPSKDSVSWGAILGGMALNGLGKRAVELFSLMIRHGVRPDGIAFLAILSACCHAGLVDQGLLFFDAMGKVYGINPGRKHYACVVDMFGRAGMLEEAEAFIQDMPMEPDGHIWGALLSACKIHGRGEETCQRLRQRVMDGKVVAGGGTYALMSNTYAGAGEWSRAMGMREAMRLRGIKKAAGCSWIDDSGNGELQPRPGQSLRKLIPLFRKTVSTLLFTQTIDGDGAPESKGLLTNLQRNLIRTKQIR